MHRSSTPPPGLDPPHHMDPWDDIRERRGSSSSSSTTNEDPLERVELEEPSGRRGSAPGGGRVSCASLPTVEEERSKDLLSTSSSSKGALVNVDTDEACRQEAMGGKQSLSNYWLSPSEAVFLEGSERDNIGSAAVFSRSAPGETTARYYLFSFHEIFTAKKKFFLDERINWPYDVVVEDEFEFLSRPRVFCARQ